MKYYVLEYRDKQILRAFLINLENDDPADNKQLAVLVGVDYTRMISVCAQHRPLLVRYKVSKEQVGKNTVKEMYAAIGDDLDDKKCTSCSFSSVKEFFDYIGFDSVTYEFAPDSPAMRQASVH